MTRFHHVSLNCRDMALMEDFYTCHLDFRRARLIDLPDGRRIVFLRGVDGVYLELFPAQGDSTATPGSSGEGSSGEGQTSPGVRNFSFAVDDIDERLSAMGSEARVTFGPVGFDDFVPGWRSVWLADPEGNVYQLTQGFMDQDNVPPAS